MINFVALLVMVVLQPLFGHLSDRIGRKPLLIFFGIGGTLCTVPLFTLMAGASNAIVKAELFPSEIRALGVGMPYGLTVALFGGTVNYIALWLRSIHLESAFFWYVSGAVFISLLVYAFVLKPGSLIDEEMTESTTTD